MNYSIDKDLLIKYFSGLAEPEEALRVQDWRKEADDNESYFQELLRSWSMTNGYESPDVDLQWQALLPHIPAMTKRISVKKNKMSPWRWSPYAAVLIIAIGIGLWQFNKKAPETLMTWEYAHDPAPIELKNNATVQLHAGGILKQLPDTAKDLSLFALQGNADIDFQQPFPEFRLRLPSGIWLRDIGTKFSVEGDEHYATVTVRTGIVEVWNDEARHQVRKNKVLQYNALSNSFLIEDLKGNFDYKDLTLGQVCDSLGIYFHVDIRAEDQALAGKMLTLSGRQLDLQQVLDIISTTLDIHYDATHDQEKVIFTTQ